MSQSTTEGSQGMKAETEAQTMEKCYSLAHSPSLAQTTFIQSMHSIAQGNGTSQINQHSENTHIHVQRPIWLRQSINSHSLFLDMSMFMKSWQKRNMSPAFAILSSLEVFLWLPKSFHFTKMRFSCYLQLRLIGNLISEPMIPNC